MTYSNSGARGVSALATDGEFIAIKRHGENRVTVHSAFAPNSVPLVIDSAHIASNGCQLLLKTTSRWQNYDSPTDDGSVSPHLFAPSSHGIVIFNLLLTFGSAGADSTTLSSPPVVVNLHQTGAPGYQCQRLTATDDGQLLACAHRTGISVLALQNLKVLEIPQAAVTALAIHTTPLDRTGGSSAHNFSTRSISMTALATTSKCVSLWWTDPSSGCSSARRLGTSTQLSGFDISALTFHPCLEIVLVASMDGTIHFLSTAASSPCVATGSISLPALCSSALKTSCTLYPPPRTGCSKLTSERVSMHAAALRAAEQSSWGAAAKTGSIMQLEVTEWCSTLQRVLSMCFVSNPGPAESAALQGNQAQLSLTDCGDSAESSLFPEPWRLVVITGNAALTLNPAGMLLTELNLFGAATTAALNHAAASCNVRVAPACSFMAGVCAIAPTCVRFTRPSQQGSKPQSSKHHMPSRSNLSKPAAQQTLDSGGKGSRTFVGTSLRMPLVGADCLKDAQWEALDSGSTEEMNGEDAQEAESLTAHGVMCVVAGEFGDQAEALWLRGNSDLESWTPQELPEQLGSRALSGHKEQSSGGRNKACVLKAAVVETQVKTCWQRRLSVFSTGSDTASSLLSRSPFQISHNPTASKGKNVAAVRTYSKAGPGHLSSRTSSTQPGGARASAYKGQGSGKAVQKAPVTFNRKIASSGYGMTYPKQQLGKLPPKPRRPETDPGAHSANILKALGAQGRDSFHVWSSRARCETAAKFHVGSAPITSLAVSPDGSQMLVGSASGELLTLPTLLSGQRQVSPCGHGNVPILSTGWSHSGKHVLSSCQDGVVCIWTCQGTEPTLTLTSAARTGTKQAAVAAFCAMDRLVMVGSGNTINMFWWNIPEHAVDDDVERLKQRAKAELGFSMPLVTGLRVTALACQNGLSPNIALVATSDSALHALDIAVGCPVATVSAAHPRPVERLAFVPASPFVNADTAAVACNTVLASSRGGCVKLWDVRNMKPIRAFGTEQSGKKGTCASAAAAVSACGCLVACGAANPAEVHTYDVRMAGLLQVLQQDVTAVPSAMEFVAGQPLLLAGCQGGQICSFTQ